MALTRARNLKICASTSLENAECIEQGIQVVAEGLEPDGIGKPAKISAFKLVETNGINKSQATPNSKILCITCFYQ
jgi:hypothetical protein